MLNMFENMNFLNLSARLESDVKFCPKCGAVDVFWASGLPQLWSIWECRNCGYRGAFVIEDGELAEKLREKYASKNVKK